MLYCVVSMYHRSSYTFRIILALLLIGSFGIVTVVAAPPPVGGYAPGDTLDPECSPVITQPLYSPDCGVNLDTDFLSLTDTPSTYTANQFVRVNATGTGLEFVPAPSGGSVTIGDPVINGDPNRILFLDGSGDLAQSANFTYVPDTAFSSTVEFGSFGIQNTIGNVDALPLFFGFDTDFSGTRFTDANGFTYINGTGIADISLITPGGILPFTGSIMRNNSTQISMITGDFTDLGEDPSAFIGYDDTAGGNDLSFTLNVGAGGILSEAIDNNTSDFSSFQITPTFIEINGSYRLPLADGTAGQAVVTDGAGQLSFATPTAVASLTDTYVGYGDSSNELTGSPNFQWLDSTKEFQLSGIDTTNTFLSGITYAVDTANGLSGILRAKNGAGQDVLGGGLLYIPGASTGNAINFNQHIFYISDPFGTSSGTISQSLIPALSIAYDDGPVLAFNGELGGGSRGLRVEDNSFGDGRRLELVSGSGGNNFNGGELLLRAGSSGSGTNLSGGDLYLRAGAGTGNTRSTIFFELPTPQSSGGVQQPIQGRGARLIDSNGPGLVLGNPNTTPLGFGVTAPIGNVSPLVGGIFGTWGIGTDVNGGALVFGAGRGTGDGKNADGTGANLVFSAPQPTISGTTQQDSQIVFTAAYNATNSILRFGDNVTGTNVAGTDHLILAPQSTGNADGGDLIFQVAPAGISGDILNTYINLFGLRGNGNIMFNEVDYDFPSSQGAAGTFLQNDGAGNLTWDAVTSPILRSGNALYSDDAGTSTPPSTIFFGVGAGENATGATGSNFFGSNAGSGATNAFASNFFGIDAGENATDAFSSNFLGPGAGANATDAFQSNFLGNDAGLGATNAGNSNFFGILAGANAANAANSIFIGALAGQNDTVNNAPASQDYSILLGRNTSTGGFSNSIAIGGFATNTASNEFMIGSATRPINTLILTGSAGNICTLDVAVASPSCTSDETLKTNISELESVLDDVVQIRTVNYDWINFPDAGNQIGFLAQDLEQYFPELVSIAPNGKKTVSYGGMTPILVQAIRELDMKIDEIAQYEAPDLWATLTEEGEVLISRVVRFASRVFAREICLEDEYGVTCITRGELNSLLTSNALGGSEQINTPFNDLPSVEETPQSPDAENNEEAPASEEVSVSDEVSEQDAEEILAEEVVDDSSPENPSPEPESASESAPTETITEESEENISEISQEEGVPEEESAS
jgi:hypothetical protein